MFSYSVGLGLRVVRDEPTDQPDRHTPGTHRPHSTPLVRSRLRASPLQAPVCALQRADPKRYHPPRSLTLDDGGQPLPSYGSQRPNIVGTPERNHGSDWVDNYFVDNNVFQRLAPFTLGDAPRAMGAVRSPSHFTADLSVGKQFQIREEMNFEFRVEARNAFNHPVFGTPDTQVGDDTFGTINSTSVGPRELQLGFKFNF